MKKFFAIALFAIATVSSSAFGFWGSYYNGCCGTNYYYTSSCCEPVYSSCCY